MAEGAGSGECSRGTCRGRRPTGTGAGVDSHRRGFAALAGGRSRLRTFARPATPDRRTNVRTTGRPNHRKSRPAQRAAVDVGRVLRLPTSASAGPSCRRRPRATVRHRGRSRTYRGPAPRSGRATRDPGSPTRRSLGRQPGDRRQRSKLVDRPGLLRRSSGVRSGNDAAVRRLRRRSLLGLPGGLAFGRRPRGPCPPHATCPADGSRHQIRRSVCVGRRRCGRPLPVGRSRRPRRNAIPFKVRLMSAAVRSPTTSSGRRRSAEALP